MIGPGPPGIRVNTDTEKISVPTRVNHSVDMK
jgi:hypothetical protein